MDPGISGILDEAAAALKGGKPRQAVAVLTPWLNLHLEDATAWQLLMTARSDLGEWTQACEAAVRTVRLRRDDPDAYCDLGAVLLKLDRIVQAQRVMRKALEIDPTHTRALLLRAEIRALLVVTEEPILRHRFMRSPGTVLSFAPSSHAHSLHAFR
jgi:Flp pilus assembly protein TadD